MTSPGNPCRGSPTRPGARSGAWIRGRTGSPPDGPFVDALEDTLELIASGHAVAIVSAGLRGDSLRPDLTTVPLEGVEPSHVVLATRRDGRGGLVAAFRAAAQRCLVRASTASS